MLAHTMKKLLYTAATILLTCTALTTISAQTAVFSYDDMGAGGGTANSGTYHPGDSFTFQIALAFTSGGTISNLDGLSYWFQQTSPASSPYPFTITSRDTTVATGNLNSQGDLQTPGMTYPQNLNPGNANDLGQAVAAGPADGNGTYIVANITMTIPNTSAFGTYVLSNTLTGGKTSVITDSNGHTFAIPEADYTVTLVPEPGTWAAAILAIAGLVVIGKQRRALAALKNQ